MPNANESVLQHYEGHDVEISESGGNDVRFCNILSSRNTGCFSVLFIQ